MIKKIISIAFVLSLLTSQTIIHDPIYTLQRGKAFEVEASIIGYLGPQSDATATLFYRSYGQETFFNSKMTYINGKYKFSIPASFIKGAIEYYIILEINNRSNSFDIVKYSIKELTNRRMQLGVEGNIYIYKKVNF